MLADWIEFDGENALAVRLPRRPQNQSSRLPVLCTRKGADAVGAS